MRIAWDGRALVGSKTGIGWYTHHLLSALSRLEAEFTGDLFLNGETPEHFGPRVRKTVVRFPKTVHLRFFWEGVLLPRALRGERFDLWHSPLAVIPERLGMATVATIHDIAFVLFPEIQPASYRRYWTRWTERACRRADRLIAVSESTKRDLLNHFETDPAKIAVVYEAADPFMAAEPSHEEVNRVRINHNLPESFLLFVGTLEPRKNLPFLCRVYETAEKRGRKLPPLVAAGGKGWLESEWRDSIARMGGNVRILGYLDRVDLRVIYRLASLVLVPSLYEGFGLQAAEAMASGAAVVAADVSALPEVIGEGGVLLPITDPEIWVDKIVELMENPSLREALKGKAKLQASLFSWEKAARETFEVYREAVEQRGG